MRIRYCSMLLGLCAMLSTTIAGAQSALTGRVRSPRGEPIAGAQVVLVLSKLTTLTNDLGSYRVAVNGIATDTLRITRLGYTPVTVVVRVGSPGDQVQDVTLVPSAVSLEALVVTGTAMGSERLRAQSAVIGTIDAAELARTAPIASLADILTARVSGVSVLQSSGTSGTSQAIRIRGSGSISLAKDPLIYVDGVLVDSRNTSGFSVGGQTSSRLNDINPADIEKIEIVKGPAAATLYGADASAGVIQVITKRGRTGAGQPFSQNLGLEYNDITMPWVPSDNYGKCTAALVAATSLNPLCRGQVVGAVVHDNPILRDNVFRDGTLGAIDWSGRGGGNAYGFFLSFNNSHEDGIFRNNFVTRRNGRANVNWQPSAAWSLSVGSSVTGSETRLPNNDNGLGFMVLTRQGSPLTRVDDSVATRLGQRNGWFQPNRRREALEAIDSRLNNLRSTSTITIDYMTRSWFRNRLTTGVDLSTTEGRQLFPKNLNVWYPGTQNDGQLVEDRLATRYMTFDYQGNLHGTMREIVSDFSFGVQLLDNRTTDLNASGTGLVTNENANINATPAVSRTYGQSFVETRSLGYLAQWQLAFKDRLFVQAGLRRDQNSSFGPNADAFYLPKLGISWVPSEDPRWPEKLHFINTLKLRGAWGTSGRSPTPGAALQTYIASPYVLSSTTTAAGVVPQSPGNANLRPERGVEYEAGIDAALWGDRVGTELTWFRKESRDLLIAQTLPPSLGFSASPFANLGGALNTGVEVGVHGAVLQGERIGLELRTSMNTLHSELTDLGGIAAFGSPVRFNVGQQLAYWNTLKLRRVDVAAGRAIVSDTAEFIGNQVPTFEGNVGGTLTLFREARLTATMDWKRGYRIYNLSDDIRDRTSSNLPSYRSVTRDSLPAEERLRFFGPFFTEGTTSPSHPVSADQVIEPYVQDASFTRLREVSLTVSLARRLVSRMGASSGEITLAGRNLALWTKYEGADPEVQRNPNETNVLIDNWTVPPTRRYVLRLSLLF